jgi:hypothetical protein
MSGDGTIADAYESGVQDALYEVARDGARDLRGLREDVA